MAMALEIQIYCNEHTGNMKQCQETEATVKQTETMSNVTAALVSFAKCNNGESQVSWVTSHEFLHHFSCVLSHSKKQATNSHSLGNKINSTFYYL